MEQENLLDELEPQFDYEIASSGQRFLNYLIDSVIASLISVFVLMVLDPFSVVDNEDDSINIILIYVTIYSIFVGYYTLMEGLFKGKTFGKLLTRTRAIQENGQRMTVSKAFIRSLCRLVPFEALSALFDQRMWHDKWTNTVVVKD